MSDLSKRLRGIGNECVALGYASLRHNYFEAADELDRLNAQALELCAEISGLRRENERLRSDVASMRHDLAVLRGFHHEGCMAEIARLRGLLQRHYELRGKPAREEWVDGGPTYRLAMQLWRDTDAALAGAAVQPEATQFPEFKQGGAEAVIFYGTAEAVVMPTDPTTVCQHDLQLPNDTITSTRRGTAECTVCNEVWKLPHMTPTDPTPQPQPLAARCPLCERTDPHSHTAGPWGMT